MSRDGSLTTIPGVMARKTQHAKTKEALERSEIAEQLRALAGQVEAGEVHLDEAEEPVTMKLPAMVLMQFKAGEKRSEDKGVKHSISLKLSWRESQS